MTTTPTTPPTNPKKRSLMPSGKLRRALRAHGHGLAAIVRIGKGGASPAVLKQVERALADHELIKVRVDADSPDDRYAAADQLAERPGVNIVQIVGHAILVYKRHPHEPRYEGSPEARALRRKPARAGGSRRPGRGSARRGR
jgi:RNA-binding protein